MKRLPVVFLCIFALAVLAAWAPEAEGFERYNDGCQSQSCHGNFTSDTSPAGTVFPNNDIHRMHRHGDFMNTDCDLCHTDGDNRNPYIGSSNGTTDNTGFGCVGCHGRQEDAGNDSISQGLGAGLRQHHWNKDEISCIGCHSDSNPANYTPVGEDVFPPYYGTVDTRADEPCNPLAQSDTNENWSISDFIGLDNDGDGLYDTADPDCAPQPVCGDGVIEGAEECDDGNTQAGDCCAPDCTFESQGSPCPDGVFCNGDETCDGAGACLAGSNVVCPGGQVCDETAGDCVTPPECTVDIDCDDGAFCNGIETCDAGACVPGTAVNCDDGVVCTEDSCNEASDICTHTPINATCDNDLFCDGVETCDPINDCQPGVPIDCGPSQVCDEDTNQCVTPPDCAVDADCDDGAFCNGTETCVAGTCQAGTAVDCTDGVACTVDTCDEVNDVCVNTPNDNNCPDDSLFCTGQEICDPQSGCVSSGDPCPVDSVCNDATDTCESIIPVENDCFDGNDNDNDGLTDCADTTDCENMTSGSCATGVPGICSSGTTTCVSGQALCMQDNQSNPEVCTNGIDDDCDNLVDGDDPDCGGCVPTARKEKGKKCDDGIDNDCNGLIDSDDPSCWHGRTIDSPEVCDDGIDNDGNGKVDCDDRRSCSKDPSCT